MYCSPLFPSSRPRVGKTRLMLVKGVSDGEVEKNPEEASKTAVDLIHCSGQLNQDTCDINAEMSLGSWLQASSVALDREETE